MVSALPASIPQEVGSEASDTGAIMTVKGLCKQFAGSERRVVDQVSFAVDPGSCVALIGPNGAGKSTLLRCCLRLVEPDAGRITLFGQTYSDTRGRVQQRLRSRVGMVFQKGQLVPQLSVLSNVLHGAYARRRGPRSWLQAFAPQAERERAMACLETVGLVHLARRPAAALSGGEAQRTAIARALMQDPEVLFADEPAASLDPVAGREVMACFTALARERGLTLVFVSHNLDHAVTYADRLLGLRHGRLLLDEPVSDGLQERVGWLYD